VTKSKMLENKLAELEREIERFRSENATLAKLRLEREKVRALLESTLLVTINGWYLSVIKLKGLCVSSCCREWNS
jgi:hypothetical protein